MLCWVSTVPPLKKIATLILIKLLIFHWKLSVVHLVFRNEFHRVPLLDWSTQNPVIKRVEHDIATKCPIPSLWTDSVSVLPRNI